jgi:flagellin-like protein
MKKIWAVRKDSEAVSPVIATILMVAITVVLAAVLYVMVLGFGGTSGSTPSLQITTRTALSDPEGYKFTLTTPTAEVTWTDFSVILQTGANSATWNTAAQSSLTGSGVQAQALGAQTLGTTSFFVNVTDLGGNGVVTNGDYFTITGDFTSGTQYTVILLHEPTGGRMVEQSWTA